MKTIGFYNGKWAELEKLSVPCLDRACYFGDGIYDAAYTKNKVIFAENEHIERFLFGCSYVGLCMPYTFEEISALLRYGVSQCDDDDLFVYFQASCGCGVRNHADRRKKASLWIMIYPKKIAPPEKSLRLLTVQDTRYDLCFVKTLNLIPNVLAAQQAEERGCDEAVFIRNGEIAECAHSNISVLKNGVLLAPPPSFCTLDGLGRRHLLTCARSFLRIEERRCSVEELFTADEIIVTSSGYPCQRAVEIDGKAVGQKDNSSFSRLSRLVYREIADFCR